MSRRSSMLARARPTGWGPRPASLVAALVAIAPALLGGGAAWAANPHNISISNPGVCMNCHSLHPGSGPGGGIYGILPRGAQQEAMCKTCHNPTGPGGDAKISNHVVDDGTKTIDCGSCHNPHGSMKSTDPHAGGVTADNLHLIRTNTSKYVPGALEPAVFQTKPAHFAFSDAEPPWNGVCQTCHQSTNHHTRDGTTDHQHNVGMSCVICHTHESGFAASGGCTDCHAVNQGARRKIVGANGDFSLGSGHVGSGVKDSDCTTCHYVGSHGSGTVKLRDPDVGLAKIYSFDAADPAASEAFCTGCHDGDGAKAAKVPMQPFSDGKTPPDIAAGGLWAGSAHKTIAYPSNGNKPISCYGNGSTTGCHGNAHGSANVKLLAAAAGVTMSNICFKCHTDGKITNNALAGSVNDMQEAMAQGDGHDMGTSFTVNGKTFKMECTTCHNPHVVTGKHWNVAAGNGISPVTRPDTGADPATNPRAMGATLWGAAPGQKMKDFAAKAAGTGGWYRSVARGRKLVFDQPAVYRPPKLAGGGWNYEAGADALPDYVTLCLDCHTHTMGPHPPVNWGQGIACTGNSVDPPNKRIECGAQHGLGAANKPSYWGDVGKYGSSGNPDPIFAEPGVTRGRGAGHFMRWPYDSVDRNAGINFVMSCTDCHEAHRSPVSSMLRTTVNNYGAGTPIWNTMCNNCHYYYGGQHAGMSCGNASCHEANSIHRIVKNTSSGGTFLWTEPSHPTTTPEIATVAGTVGSKDLKVTFTAPVWTSSNQTGALTAADLLLTDVNADNSRVISSVTHNAGEATAIVTMSKALAFADVEADLLAARGISVWDAEGDPAGPWPVKITACPTTATFGLNEGAGSATTKDDSGLMVGKVGDPAVNMPGDGSFHGNGAELTSYVVFDDPNDKKCLANTKTFTVEVRYKPFVVDLDSGDPNVNTTPMLIVERRYSWFLRQLRADWWDTWNPPAGKAFFIVKFRALNKGPGGKAWHQSISNGLLYPIVPNHWYRVRVVFNSAKVGIMPLDIFIDDEGTDGNGAGENWAGYKNCTALDATTGDWAALPGDEVLPADGELGLGAKPSNKKVNLNGLIDWVTWKPTADYSGLSDPPLSAP